MLSGARVKVEHVIAGIKRCRIIKDVFRLTKKGTSDVVMEIACALHNLRVSIRHPLPTFDLLNFVSHAKPDNVYYIVALYLIVIGILGLVR